MALRFGRLPKRHDPRTVLLNDYIPVGAPPIPPSVEYWQKIILYWYMMMNDRVGCCTLSAKGHFTMMWTAYSGYEYIPSDGQIIADYSAITGYDPSQTDAQGNNPTDQGANMLDVLNYWRKPGMMGTPIEGYAAVDITNEEQIKQAIYLFGGVDVGFDVPQSAMDQFNAGQPWDVVGDDGGIVGGHDVPVLGYDSNYYAITWGQVQKMTPAFWMKYVREAYAISSPYWLNKKGLTPAGFGVNELRRDLGLMGKRH